MGNYTSRSVERIRITLLCCLFFKVPNTAEFQAITLRDIEAHRAQWDGWQSTKYAKSWQPWLSMSPMMLKKTPAQGSGSNHDPTDGEEIGLNLTSGASPCQNPQRFWPLSPVWLKSMRGDIDIPLLRTFGNRRWGLMSVPWRGCDRDYLCRLVRPPSTGNATRRACAVRP